MSKTYKIKLDQNTKDFYHNMFLARKLQTWVEMYKALHGFIFDDDISDLDDKVIISKLSDKDIAKNHLSAAEYEEYLKYYDELFIKE